MLLYIMLIFSISIRHLRTLYEVVNPDEYCKMKCPTVSDMHTICQFKCRVAKDCVEYEEYDLNDKERGTILHAHNMYRQKLASGKDKRGDNSAAKDMRVLYYDKELEIAVSCWGRRCRFAHDRCRHTPSYASAGQNLFQQSSSAPIDAFDEKYLNTSVKHWYEEIEDTNPDMIWHFAPILGTQIGHFTQVIWANTVVIGCTRVTYEQPQAAVYRFNMHLLCNYSPTGNIIGSAVYWRGAGCAGQLRKSPKYPALCDDPAFLKSLGDRTLKRIVSPRRTHFRSRSKQVRDGEFDKNKSDKDKQPPLTSNAEIATILENSYRLLTVAISVCGVWTWCKQLALN